VLTNLLATAGGAVGVAAPGPGATALQEVIRTINDRARRGRPRPRRHDSRRHRPRWHRAPDADHHEARAKTPARPGFYAYRASIGTVKMAKNKRSAKITITCPAIARKGCCLVTLSGNFGAKKAFAVSRSCSCGR